MSKRFTDEHAPQPSRAEQALAWIIESLLDATITAQALDTLMPDGTTVKKMYYQTEFCPEFFLEALRGCGEAERLLEEVCKNDRVVLEEFETDRNDD